MALTNGGSFSGAPLIFLNPRSQDKDGNKVSPHFEIARVNDEKKIKPTGETATKVTGDLLRPKFTQREYKGNMNKHVCLYIRDGEETYSLDLTYRIASRALFNALISLTDPKGIEVSIYENKGGFETLSLWQNGKLVPWKYDGRKGEIPEPITVKFKGKDQRDFTPVDDFFEAELKTWADSLFGAAKAATPSASEGLENTEPPASAVKTTAAKTATKATTPKSETVPPSTEGTDEDVPF